MKSKENIFARFVNFIKKFFINEEPKQITEMTEVISKQESKSNFLDELRIYTEKNDALLKLQNKYEKNEIDLCVMSNEQIHELNLLYKRQVSELKKNLIDKKTELDIKQRRIKAIQQKRNED